MKTATLQYSVELVNTGANTREVRIGPKDDDDGLFFVWELTSAAPVYVDYKCVSARLVGGSTYQTQSHAVNATFSPVSTTLIPLFSIRPKATINGIQSRAQLFPKLVSFFAETQPGALTLLWNPTLTGATWLATSPSAGVEFDTAATVVTGGTAAWRVALGANMSGAYDISQMFSIQGRKLRRQAFTGTGDILTFAAIREGTSNFTAHASLTFDELR